MCVSQISFRLLKAAMELGVFPATYKRRSHWADWGEICVADSFGRFDCFDRLPGPAGELDPACRFIALNSSPSLYHLPRGVRFCQVSEAGRISMPLLPISNV